MRVTDIGLYTNEMEIINFSLSGVSATDQYMVREIIGLDSEELVPRFYGFGLQSKPKFYDFVMKARLIVMRVVLNPRFNLDETYSDIRDTIYKAISAVRTGQVVLHFNSGGSTVARIFGFITKMEVNHFSALPEVQITIRCDDPMFRAINPVYYTADELRSTNPIIVPDSLSTAPHGIQIEMTCKTACPSFTIQDEEFNPEWMFKITPDGGFLAGDILHLSSESASKQLYITRGQTDIYLVDKLSQSSIWPIIFPGATTFHFVDLANFDWNSLVYYAAYWGV